MKLAKILGLAVAAALASMALVGPSTASATVLCNVHPKKDVGVDKCPAANVVQAGTQLTLTNKGNTFFKEQEGIQQNLIECPKSTISGEVTNADQVAGQVNAATFTQQPPEVKCDTPAVGGVEKVEVRTLNLPYNASANYEGQQLSQDGTEQVGFGKVIAEGKPNSPIQFEFVQGALDCDYELKPPMEGKVQGKAINGSLAQAGQQSQVEFDGTQAEFQEKGPEILCPDSGKYVASYEVKAGGNDVYIAKEQQ